MAKEGTTTLPPRVVRLGDDRRQPLAAIVGRVEAIAVGRFHQQHVRCRHGLRVAKHRTVVAPEIAAEHDGHRRSSHRHHHGRGAQQVTDRDERDLDAGHDRHRPMETCRLQLRQRLPCIGDGVEWQSGIVLGVVVPIRLAGVFFL